MLVERPDETVVPETVQGMIAARIDTLPTRGEGAPPGRRGRRAGSSGSARSGASGGRSRSGCTPSSGRSSCDASADRPSPARTSTSSATRSSATSPTSRSREPSVRTSIARAAEWIESLGRPDDHAEMLAHHYAAALEFARVSGQDVGDLPDRAQSAAREAGDRASALNAYARAARFYERALDLIPADDPRRGRLLLVLGRSLWLAEARGEDELVAAQRGSPRSERSRGGGRGGGASRRRLLEPRATRARRRASRARVRSRRRARAFADEGIDPLPCWREARAARATTPALRGSLVTRLRSPNRSSSTRRVQRARELGRCQAGAR